MKGASREGAKQKDVPLLRVFAPSREEFWFGVYPYQTSGLQNVWDAGWQSVRSTTSQVLGGLAEAGFHLSSARS